MPGPTLPNTGIVLPALGGDAGTWDIELNACFSNYDVHDHSAGKGVKITPSGISINAALSFAGNPASNVGQVAFSEVAALAAGADIIFVNSADHELYWRTAGGVNVKLTAGNSINTSLVGGILGDYSTVGAQFSYDDANTQYLAKTKTPFNWAYVHSGGVRLAPAGGSSALYTGVLCNAAIAGSFNITLPSALPAGSTFMMMDASGNVTTTASPSATAYKYTTAVPKTIPASEADPGSCTRQTGVTSTGTIAWQLSSGGVATFPLSLQSGDVVNAYVVFFKKNTANTTSIHAQIYQVDMTTGTEAAVGTGVSFAGNATGVGNMFEVLSMTADASHAYYVVVTPVGAGITDLVYAVQPSITHP